MTGINIILAIHIAGALLTPLFFAAGMYQCVTRRGNIRATRIAAFSLIAAQIISGIGLILYKPGISVMSVCTQGLFIITSIVIVQNLVSYRVKTAEVIN